MFFLNKACQFLATPTNLHWSTVKRILRYLKLLASTGLAIQKSSSMLLGAFSDADWTGYPDDRRSTGGMRYILVQI